MIRQFVTTVPEMVTGTAGPRKRHVLFTRPASNMRKFAEYFDRHPYAPSEHVQPATAQV